MKTILVVDDETELRAAVKIRLEVEGYQVIEAANGKEALEIIAQRNLDLIILDMMMPVLDGYTTLKKLKADQSRAAIPVIVLSIKEQINMEGLFIPDMVEGYVEKPFETEQLMGKVKAILGE